MSCTTRLESPLRICTGELHMRGMIYHPTIRFRPTPQLTGGRSDEADSADELRDEDMELEAARAAAAAGKAAGAAYRPVFDQFLSKVMKTVADLQPQVPIPLPNKARPSQ